jgi:hypothetical protein
VSKQQVVGRRTFAICAIGGPLVLLVGTLLHPSQADANFAPAAFAEYAGDQNWVTTHLLQLAGVALMTAALVLLSRAIAEGPAGAAAALGKLGAGATFCVAVALQGVDGVALKSMVDAWAAAGPSQKDIIFQATFGVRQIEI